MFSHDAAQILPVYQAKTLGQPCLSSLIRVFSVANSIRWLTNLQTELSWCRQKSWDLEALTDQTGNIFSLI